MATFSPNHQSLIDQIPKEDRKGPPVTTPANSGIHSTEFGRQAYNTAMALPGVGGLPKAAGAAPAVSRLMNTSVAGATTLGGAAKAAAPYTLPAAVLGGASIASQPDQPNRSLAAQASSAPPAVAQPSVPISPLVEAANNITKTIDPHSGATSYSGENIKDGFTMNGKPTSSMLGGGAISSQNMQAADRLAGGNSLMRAAGIGGIGSAPQPLRAPTVAHSGNDFAARKRLENLKTSASSITNRPQWGGGRRAEQNPSVMAYLQAQQADLAAQGKQPDMDMQTLGLNAGVMREGMQQAGADRRDAARLGMEQQAQAPQNRARSLMAAMQEQIAAEQDPGRRSSLVQHMRDVEGKNAEVDPYLVVPGGQQLNEQGQAYTAPSSVFNRRSGAFLQQPGEQKATTQYAVGTVSRVGNREATWDGSKWIPK